MASREPFSGRRVVGTDGPPDKRAVLRAFEFAARTYGWTADYIYRHETKERVLAYFDVAHDRHQQEFGEAVDAARLGYLFAHDPKAYQRWRRKSEGRSDRPASLSGAALEAAVMRVSEMFPDNVVRA